VGSKRTPVELALLTLTGCATYVPPPKPLALEDYIVFVDNKQICSATDGVRIIAWSCR
jgi:hypothetical protein